MAWSRKELIANPQPQGSAKQQRCSLPVARCVPAPPELQRWAFSKKCEN